MSPAIAGMKLTYDDLLLFPEDGKRHELIDGEHYVSPSPIMPPNNASNATRRWNSRAA